MCRFVYMQVCMCRVVYVQGRVYVGMHVQLCVQVCMCLCVGVSVSLCMYNSVMRRQLLLHIHTYTHTHTHAYKHTPQYSRQSQQGRKTKMSFKQQEIKYWRTLYCLHHQPGAIAGWNTNDLTLGLPYSIHNFHLDTKSIMYLLVKQWHKCPQTVIKISCIQSSNTQVIFTKYYGNALPGIISQYLNLLNTLNIFILLFPAKNSLTIDPRS